MQESHFSNNRLSVLISQILHAEGNVWWKFSPVLLWQLSALNLHIYDYSFQDYLGFQHLKSGNYTVTEKGCRDSVLSVHIYTSVHVNSSYTE